MKLLEFPYFNDQFDLEIEKTNLEEFKEILQKIFSGKEVQDKYGNKFQLKSKKIRKEFLDFLKSDSNMRNIVKFRFKLNQNKWNVMLNGFLNESFKEIFLAQF